METSLESTENTKGSNALLKEPWHAPLNRVTTVSKILAAIVFITLPFVGFWLGYEMSEGTEEEMFSVELVQTDGVVPVVPSETSSTIGGQVILSQASTTQGDEDMATLLPKEFFNTPAIRSQTRILAVGDLNDDGLLDAFAQDEYTPGQDVADHSLKVLLLADPKQGGVADKVIVTFPGEFVPDMKKVSIDDGYLKLSGSFGGVYRSDLPEEVPFFYNGREMLSLWTPETTE